MLRVSIAERLRETPVDDAVQAAGFVCRACTAACRTGLSILAGLLLAVQAPAPASAQEARTHSVPLFASASDPDRQGFARVINRSRQSGRVAIEAFDDAGERHGPVHLTLAAGQTSHFNSDDLEQGNADKGLSGGIGIGETNWRLELSSELDLVVLSYMRTVDGFLTSLHDLVPEAGGTHEVAIFNPGSNPNQVSSLRLINPGDEAAQVEIAALDDKAASPGDTVRLTIEPYASRMLTAAELETGSADGLSGALGDGEGKWRLRVRSDNPIQAMSLLESPTGHLTNLSSVPPPTVDGDVKAYRVNWFPPAWNRNQGFIRVINHSKRDGAVKIQVVAPHVLSTDTFQHSHRIGPIDTIELQLAANSVAHFNSRDLEQGNIEKGLSRGVGTGPPLWQLEFRSDLNIEVLSYIRTPDGFLTSMHDLVPEAEDVHHVEIFNPGSNLDQESLLVLVNPYGHEEVAVKITGVDDQGESPGSSVDLYLDCCQALVLSALDLEVGRQVSGFGLRQTIEYFSINGALGDGDGKWRLRVESDHPTYVISLLRSPTGHLTNLSSDAGASLLHIDASDSTPLPATEPVAAEVSIPDADLQRIVEATLGKAEDAPISAAEMATLTRLYAGSTFPWLDPEDMFCVTELNGLEFAVNLEKLYLSKNCVEDLTPLAGLTRLTELFINGTNVDDLSPLATATNLKVLDLEDVYLNDISPLAGLTNLEKLNFAYTDVDDLSPLASLSNLRVLDTRSGDVQDHSPLTGLTGLEILKLLGDPAPASRLINLKELWLGGVSNFTPVANLTNLEKLNVATSHTAILAPLVRLPNLKVLRIGGRLDVLGGGDFSDISPLREMTGLVDLYLRGQVEDILALTDMTLLAKVFLPDNRIRDLQPLVANPGLGAADSDRGYADYLYIPRNPLSDQSINQHIPALQKRGVRVDFRPTIAE